MKKFTILFSFLFSVVVCANAQLKVDSLGCTHLGVIPEETFDKVVEANTTIFNSGNLSTLNLYCDNPSIASLKDNGAPYFIQCISGNTNETTDGSTGQAGVSEFHRVFYVNSDGIVYAKSGVLYEAVDPGRRPIFSSRSMFKTNISALTKLEGISGVSYTDSDAGSNSGISAMSTGSNGRARLGLLAEEVEATVPEAVVTLGDNTKCISYSDLVVVLIDAVNELNGEVERLKEELESSPSLVESRKSPSVVNALKSDRTYISQNTPNPFDSETVIEYSLSDGVSDAFVCIYDMQGKQIKRYDLYDKQGRVTIAASELDAGMYIYSLIADGAEVESYRMILTK